VRASAYRFLEHAQYVDPDEELKPFAPSRRKIDDVVDALRAIVQLESATEVPLWTDGRTDPPAHEMRAMANGLLHVPTRTLLPPTPHLFTHHALPFAFDPAAPSPSGWLQFLNQLWGDDVDSMATLQEWMGYVLGATLDSRKCFCRSDQSGPERERSAAC
jgi:putative DNA primase/helicase